MTAGTPSSPEPLVIKSLEFLGGMAARGGWRPPVGLPEVAFAGRSNVGKSSLLNALVRRKAFARVSRTPGRTQEINFFEINGQFVFVDLPGYGYARVSKTRRDTWRPLIDAYLAHTQSLRGVVVLLDIRRDPSADDIAMLEHLADLGIPALAVITKVDKLGKEARKTAIARILSATGLEADQVIPFSAHTGEGRTEIAEAIVQLLQLPQKNAAGGEA